MTAHSAPTAPSQRDQSNEPGAAGKALAIIEHLLAQRKSRAEIAGELASLGLSAIGAALGYQHRPWNWSEHDIRTFAASFADPLELVRAVLRQCEANDHAAGTEASELPQVPQKVIAAVLAYGDARADDAPTGDALATAIVAMREWAGALCADTATDAARFRHMQKGHPLTVTVPTPTEDKPNKKVLVIYGPNEEANWATALAQAVDAERAAGVPKA